MHFSSPMQIIWNIINYCLPHSTKWNCKTLSITDVAIPWYWRLFLGRLTFWTLFTYHTCCSQQSSLPIHVKHVYALCKWHVVTSIIVSKRHNILTARYINSYFPLRFPRHLPRAYQSPMPISPYFRSLPSLVSDLIDHLATFLMDLGNALLNVWFFWHNISDSCHLCCGIMLIPSTVFALRFV